MPINAGNDESNEGADVGDIVSNGMSFGIAGGMPGGDVCAEALRGSTISGCLSKRERVESFGEMRGDQAHDDETITPQMERVAAWIAGMRRVPPT